MPFRGVFYYPMIRTVKTAAILVLIAFAIQSCSTAPKQGNEGDTPALEESETPRKGERIPSFEDLRGYLLPEKITPNSRRG